MELPYIDLSNIDLSNIDLSNVILLVTTAGASVSAALVNVQKKLKENVVGMISAAEEEYEGQEKAGADKYAWVVEQLYLIVPLPFRPLFSRKLIGRIVGSAFGNVESYARMQAPKLVRESEREDWTEDAQPDSPACIEGFEPKPPEMETAEAAQIEELTPGDNPGAENERREPENAAKAHTANQQMPYHRIVQNPRVQGSIRIHTFWNRHGVVRGTDYCIRKWERRSDPHRTR